MIGNIINPLVAAEIGGAFGEASGHVRERLARATRREGEGQAATREDTFTDHIVDAFEQSVREQLERCFQQLDSAGVSVEFEATKAIQGEESQFGLDLGVRILIETPTYAIEKAILVQCKRMYGVGAAGTFPKLRGDGEEQAAKMLKVTPAAFFFLYCAGEGDELIELMQPATWWPPFHPLWFELGPRRAYSDPGVAVLPATRVLAMSQAAAHNNRPLAQAFRDAQGHQAL